MLNAYHEALPSDSRCVLGMLVRDPRNKVGMKDELLRMSVNVFCTHSEKDFLHKSSGMLTSVSITVF